MSDAIPTRHRTRPCLLELDARIVPSFTPLTEYTNGSSRPVVAVSADFNRDGLDDLAVFNAYHTMSWNADRERWRAVISSWLASLAAVG